MRSATEAKSQTAVASLMSVFLIGLAWLCAPPSLLSFEEDDAPLKISVLVIGGSKERDKQRNTSSAAANRLKAIGVAFTVIDIQRLDWELLNKYQVVMLPSEWAENAEDYAVYQQRAEVFHRYVKQGGGLLVSQPNPFQHPDEQCTPLLLPYPITFYNWYDEQDRQRINATHAHYITEDLAADDLPFPADKMIKWDPHYKILALGAQSESPSLVVCEYGKGRVVVQTGNESTSSINPFPDKTLKRMIVWAARQEPERFRSKPVNP